MMYYSELIIDILELSSRHTSEDWMLNLFSAAIMIISDKQGV